MGRKSVRVKEREGDSRGDPTTRQVVQASDPTNGRGVGVGGGRNRSLSYTAYRGGRGTGEGGRTHMSLSLAALSPHRQSPLPSITPIPTPPQRQHSPSPPHLMPPLVEEEMAEWSVSRRGFQEYTGSHPARPHKPPIFQSPPSGLSLPTCCPEGHLATRTQDSLEKEDQR